MKKLFLFLACVLTLLTASAASPVYVNPIQNKAGANAVIAKRLYKKGLLGLTKAKTVSISSGSKALTPGSAEAEQYDYILTFVIEDANVSEAATIGNVVGAIGGILGGSSSSQKEPDWEGKIVTNVILVDAKTGKQVFTTTLQPSATNKDKGLALFNATNNFDYDVTDMTDDAFRITGEVLEPTQVDKNNVVKKVRVQLGPKAGARKDQAFELFKVVDGNRELIGMAKCDQVLNADQSILSVNGKKGGDKVVSDLVQNLDGSYTIEASSRSKSGFLHNNFQGLDKMFTKEGRLHYMDPFNRTARPRIAVLGVEINDNQFSAQKDNFENSVVEGMREVSTIDFIPQIYSSVEAARNAGIDGLVEISIDKVFNSTEKTKEGKTKYKTEILYTVAGIDATNNKWIDMKSFNGYGESTDNATQANSGALSLMHDRIQKFSEDLFPVAATIMNHEEVKKNSVKKVRIDKGTSMGLKKGMVFDIFEQRAEGGDDARILLGEGKVEKDGLTDTEAILKVKGKNNGDVRLFDLLQNADEDTKIVAISKASQDFLDKINIFGRAK